METLSLPWLFAILTAAWFGWMAVRSGRSSALWAVGGAAFGLVASTIVIGLGRAVSIPYSAHHTQTDWIASVCVAAVIIAGVGWLLTAGLHRRHAELEQAKSVSAVAAQTPTETKPASPQPKPTTRPQT